VEAGSRRSQDMIGRKLEGSLVLTWPMVVVVRGRSDEEVAEGDLPCAVAACRRDSVHIRGEVGSPSGDRNLGVQGVGSKGHNEGEVAVCAWD